MFETAGGLVPAVAMLGVIGLLLVGGFVLIALMLAYPKTRPAGILLVVIGLAGTLGVGMLFFGYTTTRHRVVRAHEIAVREHGGMRDRMEYEAAKQRGMHLHSRRMANATAEINAGGETTEASPAAEETSATENEPVEVSTAKAADVPEEAPADDTTLTNANERPAWIESTPGRVGDVYQMAIKLDPRPNRRECENALSWALNGAVATYVRDVLKRPEIAHRVRLKQDYLRKNVVKETWEEPVEISLPVEISPEANWIQLHVLLAFDHRVKGYIENECNKVIVAGRLWVAGAALACGLALLGVLFVCLKVNQRTNGACRVRRGFIAVVAIVLAIAIAGLVVWKFLENPAAVTVPPMPEISPMGPVSIGAAGMAEAASTEANPLHFKTDFVAWALLVPAALLILGLVGGLVLLLANRRTRKATAVTVLVLGAVVITLVFLTVA